MGHADSHVTGSGETVFPLGGGVPFRLKQGQPVALRADNIAHLKRVPRTARSEEPAVVPVRHMVALHTRARPRKCNIQGLDGVIVHHTYGEGPVAVELHKCALFVDGRRMLIEPLVEGAVSKSFTPRSAYYTILTVQRLNALLLRYLVVEAPELIPAMRKEDEWGNPTIIAFLGTIFERKWTDTEEHPAYIDSLVWNGTEWAATALWLDKVCPPNVWYAYLEP